MNGDGKKVMNKEAVKKYLLGLQSAICKELEELDGEGSFVLDEWTKTQGLKGYGLTRVLAEGAVIEKISLLFSHI